MHPVGDHPGLGAREGLGRCPEFVNGHGQHGHGDAFAGRQEHVQLSAGAGLGGDLLCEIEQIVGRVTHGGDHDDDVVALVLGVDHALRDPLDTLGVGNRRTAEFLNDEAHGVSFDNRSLGACMIGPEGRSVPDSCES